MQIFRLVKDNFVAFTCPLPSYCKMLLPQKHFGKNHHFFRDKIIVIIFPFSFHIFKPLANLCFIHFQRQYTFLRTRSFLTSIHSFALWAGLWHLVFGESYSGIHSLPSFVSRLRQCPLSLPLGEVGRDFPFSFPLSEHSSSEIYASSILLELVFYNSRFSKTIYLFLTLSTKMLQHKKLVTVQRTLNCTAYKDRILNMNLISGTLS